MKRLKSEGSLFCSLVVVWIPTKGEGVNLTSQPLAGILPASDPQGVHDKRGAAWVARGKGALAGLD
jgi:hypothetical protein